MKKYWRGYLLLALIFFGISGDSFSQRGQRYFNSLRVQYGLVNYNHDQKDYFNTKDKDLQSLGISYRRQLGKVSGLSFTGRLYKWQLSNNDELKSSAAQALWVLHPQRISRSYSLNRLMPYIGVGLGFEKHQVKNNLIKDSTFSNVYIPFEAGILYNLSSRWSIGVFAEYKLASTADLKQLLQTPKGKMDIVNTAGLTLAYNFGKKKRAINAPVIFTNPNLVEIKYSKPGNKDTIKSTDPDIKKNLPVTKELNTVADTSKNINPVEKPENIKDSIKKAAIQLKDSVQSVPDTINQKKIPETQKAVQEKEDSVTVLNLVRKGVLSTDTIRIVRKEMIERELDSMIVMIKDLNTQLEDIQNEPKASAVKKDTILVQKLETNLEDEPIITNLKKSYNHLGEQVHKLYRKGDVSEEEIELLKAETENLKDSISVLSAEDEFAFDKLERLYDAITFLQSEMDRKKSNNNSPADYFLQKDMNSIQYKLDKTLLELEYMKKNTAIEQKEVIDPVIENLRKNQKDLEEKIRKMEQQNNLLLKKVEQLVPKKDTVSSLVGNKDGNILYTIHFPVNSSQISTTFQSKLQFLVDSLKNMKGYMLILSGYADKSGNAEYNKKLTQRRVSSVKNELVKFGLNKEYLLERYFGSDKADSKLNEKDRKVVIRLLNQ